MRKPSGRAPKRNQRDQVPRRVIRVLTEGAVTEAQYLTLLARANRHQVSLQHDRETTGSAPLTLVRAAKAQLRVSDRRRSSAGQDFDEIWCVFDTDEHPNLAQALTEASDSGVSTALSNPCFELWLVLHVEDQQAHIDRHEIQRRSRRLGITDGKAICGDEAERILLTSMSAAIDRARYLEKCHELNGSRYWANPSSGMWRLVEVIRQ